MSRHRFRYRHGTFPLDRVVQSADFHRVAGGAHGGNHSVDHLHVRHRHYLSKVLAVVVLAAPVIVMNSYKGIRNTNPSLIQMCRAFLGTKRQEVSILSCPTPAALIFAGLRLEWRWDLSPS